MDQAKDTVTMDKAAKIMDGSNEENQKQVTQNVGNSESGKLHFFDSVEGATGGSLEGTTENLPERKRIPTEKGLEYFLNTKVSAFRNAKSTWCKTAKAANDLMIENPTIDQLKSMRADLVRDFLLASQIYHDIKDHLNEHDKSEMHTKLDELESSNLALISKLTDVIRDIQNEIGSGSHKSFSGSHKSNSSKSSESSQARAIAAGKVAALKAKMKYLEREAEMTKALKRMQTEAQLEMAEAKYEALTNVELTGKPYLSPHADVFEPKSQRYVQTETYNTDYFPQASFHDNKPPQSLNPAKPSKFNIQSATSNAQKSHSFTIPPQQQNIQIIKENDSFAKTLAEHMFINRLPIPEPPQFNGDPLKFPSWRATFETLIGSRSIPRAERVHYLRRYLEGQAKEAVEGFLLLSTDDAYERAMHLLDDRYGNTFAIANAFRDKLDSWPKVTARDGPGLRRLADFLYQCSAAMQNNNNLYILNDERENKRILSKLPDWIIVRWGRKVQQYRREHKAFPPFTEFATFITEEAEFANDPITALPPKGNQTENPDKGRKRFDKQARQAGAFNVATNEETSEQSRKC